MENQWVNHYLLPLHIQLYLQNEKEVSTLLLFVLKSKNIHSIYFSLSNILYVFKNKILVLYVGFD